MVDSWLRALERAGEVIGSQDPDAAAQARLREQYPADTMFGESGTGRDYREQPRTAAEQAAARKAFASVLFGPERESILPGEQQASRGERFLRDWGASEQEFRLAGQRFSEGQIGAGFGWGALAMAGAIPFFGDIAQGVARAGRGVRGAAATARAAVPPPNPALKAIDDIWHEERLEWLPDFGKPYDEITGETLEGPGIYIDQLDELENAIPGITQFSDEWAYSASVNADARQALADALEAGGEIPDTYAGMNLALGLDILSQSPPVRSPVYRASTFTPDEIGFLREGTEIDLPLSSFTYNQSDMRNFVGMGSEGRSTQVVFTLREGAPAIPIGAIAREVAPIYGEVVTAGRFRIASVREATMPQGTMGGIGGSIGGRPYLDVELEYVAPFELGEKGRSFTVSLPGSADVPAARGARIELFERQAPEPVSQTDGDIYRLAENDPLVVGSDGPVFTTGTDQPLITGVAESPEAYMSMLERSSSVIIERSASNPLVIPGDLRAEIVSRYGDQFVGVSPSWDPTDQARRMVDDIDRLGEWEGFAYSPSRGLSESAEVPFDYLSEVLSTGVPVEDVVRSLQMRARLYADAHNKIVSDQIYQDLVDAGLPMTARNFGTVYWDDLSQALNSVPLRPTIAVPRVVLSDVLDSGTIMNQYMTMSSRGALAPATRVETELIGFGISLSAGPAARPVYGYLTIPESSLVPFADGLTPPMREAMNYGQTLVSGKAFSYGEIHFVFGDQTAARTSFTVGDSLSSLTRGSPVSEITGADVGLAARDYLSVIPRGAGVRPVHAKTSYLEAQIVAPDLSDVREIHIAESANYSSRQIDDLRAAIKSITGRDIDIYIVSSAPRGTDIEGFTIMGFSSRLTYPGGRQIETPRVPTPDYSTPDTRLIGR